MVRRNLLLKSVDSIQIAPKLRFARPQECVLAPALPHVDRVLCVLLRTMWPRAAAQKAPQETPLARVVVPESATSVLETTKRDKNTVHVQM